MWQSLQQRLNQRVAVSTELAIAQECSVAGGYAESGREGFQWRCREEQL